MAKEEEKLADDKKKQIQEKYIELQIVRQQAEEVKKQLQMVQEQIVEISSVKEALSELKGCSNGSDMLVPLSSGIFVKARLESNEELAVNVGGNTVTRKSVDQTKALLEGQLTQIRQVDEQLQSNLRKLGIKAEELSTGLKALVE